MIGIRHVYYRAPFSGSRLHTAKVEHSGMMPCTIRLKVYRNLVFSDLPTPVHPAHVDYLLMVSPGKLIHSQAKVNMSRRNSHMKKKDSCQDLNDAANQCS